MNGQNYNNQPICIEEDGIDLRELFATIWKHKIFILFFVFIVTSLAIVFALSKPNEYKVSITLAPQEQSKGLNLGGLGALASMAGVNVGGGSGITPDIAFQTVLGNYKFMTNFIQKHNIDKILLNNELEKDYIFAMNNNSVYKYFHNSLPIIKFINGNKINIQIITKREISKDNFRTVIYFIIKKRLAFTDQPLNFILCFKN
jgi:LPS O-antigen subunit length determinant protein (WzzB/FepE family)